MIKPVLAGDAFLADVRQAWTKQGVLHIWWLGQSGFLVQWQGKHLLLDPYLSDALTKKYANTDKPHVRMTERVIAPHQLNFIDVVTSSHNHTDHLDAETLVPLFQANPKLQIVIPEANRAFVADRLDIASSRPIGLDDGREVCLDSFTLYGVPAAHEQIEVDIAGHHKFLGYVVQFGPWTIYHSGDTLWYPGMVAKLRPWAIDIALLPINGQAAERRVAGNLDGKEAANLAHEIGARTVIPCHYEMFEFNTASPDSFCEECERLGQAYSVLKAGERWEGSI